MSEAIKQYLEEKKGVATVMAARELNVPEREVVRALDEQSFEVGISKFGEIMDDISEWGGILMIVTNNSVICEVSGELPKGKFSHGMFNLHSDTSPIGGHLMADKFDSIHFVSRPFMGKESLSVQVYDIDGNAAFKIHVGRDEKHELKQDQVERFHALKKRMMQ
ncbi:heme utilization cystosolic carrier protein HutX [Seleniivibrio sp.]|uniref:heme utilization cystosolic carrier protein HutX n=1 Tax=Seleniivibrio sp. TaxID=2898801 RepID=UPI0025F278F7|nr:heme utilization cystosolic carrier protein HutX [Seleniivibrio sp.]MCD8553499.1 heme utilization cystosolic carrier protein HutX [Seleniivibrio sp.]